MNEGQDNSDVGTAEVSQRIVHRFVRDIATRNVVLVAAEDDLASACAALDDPALQTGSTTWDVASFENDDDALAFAQVLKQAGILAESRGVQVIFRQRDVHRILTCLGYWEQGRAERVSVTPRHIALTQAERAELLELLAEGADDESVPTLSSPLRIPESVSRLLGFHDPVEPKSALDKVFRICMQLLLIYAVCLAGERAAALIPLGIPGNILSMLLLLVFLLSGVIRMESISLAADFLLDHMAVFFVPAAVAIMGSFDIIAPNVVALLLICLATTVLVFFVTSFTVSTVMNLMAHAEARRNAGSRG